MKESNGIRTDICPAPLTSLELKNEFTERKEKE